MPHSGAPASSVLRLAMSGFRGGNEMFVMSALGQKQTSPHLQPIEHRRDVRFVPKADKVRSSGRVTDHQSAWALPSRFCCYDFDLNENLRPDELWDDQQHRRRARLTEIARANFRVSYNIVRSRQILCDLYDISNGHTGLSQDA